MKLIIAFFCAAVGFTVQWREQWLPAKPIVSPEKIAWENDRSWFHNMKNYWTEHVRAAAKADAEWWGKFLAFIVLVEFVLIWL